MNDFMNTEVGEQTINSDNVEPLRELTRSRILRKDIVFLLSPFGNFDASSSNTCCAKDPTIKKMSHKGCEAFNLPSL